MAKFDSEASEAFSRWQAAILGLLERFRRRNESDVEASYNELLTELGSPILKDMAQGS